MRTALPDVKQGGRTGVRPLCLRLLRNIRFPKLRLLRQTLDGNRILGGRHSGHFFKLPGKIVYRGIAQPVRNLGEIQTLAADKLLGRVDFHVGEIVNNSAAAPLPEQLLHLRTADEIVTADLLNGKLTGQMIFQIGEQTFIHLHLPGLYVRRAFPSAG